MSTKYKAFIRLHYYLLRRAGFETLGCDDGLLSVTFL